MKDLITIVVPIYKVEKYLEKCINSILEQTYKNIEIIFVDDGSPDNCGKICDEYAKKDSRIKVIHKENGGLSDARNAGIEIATGKYITFVDSDDYITNDYIEYLYNLIKKYNVKLSICEVKTIWKNTKITENRELKSELLDSKAVFENLLFHKGIEIAAYAKLYLTELWKEYRFPKGKAYEDTAIIYKLIEKAEKIAYGNKQCYYYVARLGSISKQKGFNKNEEDYIQNTEEMLNYIREKYPDIEVAVDRYELYANFRILRMLIYTKPRLKQMEKEIIMKIKEKEKKVFSCKDTPKRDKVAILTLKMGLPIFKFSWGVYSKLTGRIA